MNVHKLLTLFTGNDNTNFFIESLLYSKYTFIDIFFVNMFVDQPKPSISHR